MTKAAITLLLAMVVQFLPGLHLMEGEVKLSPSPPGSEVRADTSRYIYVGAEGCAGSCHNNTEMGFQYDSW